MDNVNDPGALAGRELALARILDAPPALVFRAWTDPILLKQWWAPAPFTLPLCEVDLRAGGIFRTKMRGVDGTEFDSSGLILEVIPDRRLVFTDAYREAWVPSDLPFITLIVDVADADGGKTRLDARVRHWTVAAKEEHERLGFHQGWATTWDQMEALLAKLQEA